MTACPFLTPLSEARFLMHRENDPSPSSPEPGDGPAPGPDTPPSVDWMEMPDVPAPVGLPSWLDMDLPALASAPELPEPPEPTAEAAAEAPPAPPLPPPTQEIPPRTLQLADLNELLASSRPEAVEEPVAVPGRAAAEEPSPGVCSAHKVPIARKGRGQTVGYGITARNTRPHPIHDFTIEHELPPGARLANTQPAAEVRGNRVVWKFGRVEPGMKTQVRVTAAPPAGEEFPPEGDFKISYSLKAAEPRPRLSLRVSGPKGAGVGDAVLVRVEVANRGDAPAEAASCCVELPAGLRPASGSLATFLLGTLAPGASSHLFLQLTASAAGEHVCVIVAEARGGRRAAARLTVTVAAPALRLSLDAPPPCLPGADVAGRVELSNDGNAPAEAVEVTLALPEEARPLSASDGGHCDPTAHRITWRLGSLAPGQTHTLAFAWHAELPAEGVLRARAEDARCAPVEAETRAVIGTGSAAEGGLLEELLGAIDAEMGSRLSEAAPRAAAARQTGDRYLVFTLADIDYAVPLANVLEAGVPPPATPVPHVPEWVVGVANLRGDVVSLVDLRGFLGLEAEAGGAGRRLLVVKARQEELTTGLLVDRLCGIRSLPEARLSGAEALGESPVAPFVRGITEEEGRVVVFLDLDRLLLSPAMRQFEAA